MNDIVPPKRPGLPIPKVFDGLGLDPVKKSDSFSLEYSVGLLTATVKRSNGVVEVVRRSVGNSGFTETTTFDPNAVSRDERNDLIRRFSDERMTYAEIARRTGVSISTVGNVLRKYHK